MITGSINLIVLIGIFFILYNLQRNKQSLSARILVGLLLGLMFGFLLRTTEYAQFRATIENILTLVGFGYLALLKMLVVPLILTAIINAIVNLGAGDGAILKRISFFACAMLLIMTSISSLIAIIIGYCFHVGAGLTLPSLELAPPHTYPGIVDTLLAMLPSNPVAVMTQENTIAIVLFAVLLGVAARMLDVADHDKMQTFTQLIASLFAIVKRLASLVLSLTPYGVVGLIALLVANQGEALLSGMLNFTLAMYVAMVLVLAMHSIILAFLGYSPWNYFQRAAAPLFVAFTTRSSFGTLPVTVETLRKHFHTKDITATFVPSIGATIGMNACAGVFPAMLVVMTLTILQQPLSLHIIFMVMFINAVASLGISGIPGTAYIAATVTLTSLNLPFAVIALVQGIDPIIDMGRTAVNVNGVITTALVADKSIQSETL